MAILTIVKRGTPVLHSPSALVDAKDLAAGKHDALIRDMVETMYAANGVGIAAPQVGVALKLFIAEGPDGPIALANPEFIKTSWKFLRDEEGCLSVPGEYDSVKRHRSVTVKALTTNGQPITFTADGFFARILQHETDHLNGILYVDRVKEQKEKKS